MKNTLFYFVIITLFAFCNIEAQEETQPKYLDVLRTIVASGYMGDVRNIALYENWKDVPCNEQSDSFCVKINYVPGNIGWAGIYWLNSPNNWCDGTDLSSEGYNQIVFYAKGENGGELIEFKAGDVKCPDNNQQRDSFSASLGRIRLTRDWQRYIINLHGKNMSNVIGIFCWVASGLANPNGLTFYLDDVLYLRQD